MKKHIGIIVLAAVITAGLLANTFLFQVDELKDTVLVTTFGSVTRELSGAKDAGLKIKWPWPVQKVIRYDSRAYTFEDTMDEVPTKDKQNLIITSYCTWRIASAKDLHRSVESREPEEKVALVQQRLRELVRTAKKDAIGKHNVEAFVNTDPAAMKLKQIEAATLAAVRERALRDYGVEILQIGIKTQTLPGVVTGKVIRSMIVEREQAASRYETEGAATAQAIEARAKASRDIILAFAQRRAESIRTEGDRAAAAYYERFQENPEFSIFLRRLESLKKELGSKAVILLDGQMVPAVRWLREGPSLSTPPVGATGQVEANQ